MAKLTTYEQQVNPGDFSPGRSPRDAARPSGGGVGAAISGIGSALEHLAIKRDQNDFQDVRVQIANASADLAKLRIDMQADTPDDPAGFTQRYTDQVKLAGDKLVAGIENPRAQQFARAAFARLGSHLAQQAMAWEATQSVDYAGNRIGAATDAYARFLGNDDSAYPQVREGMMGMIDTSRLLPALRENYRIKVAAALAEAAAQGRLLRDPNGTQAAVNAAYGLPAQQGQDGPPAPARALPGQLTFESVDLSQVEPSFGAAGVKIAAADAYKSGLESFTVPKTGGGQLTLKTADALRATAEGVQVAAASTGTLTDVGVQTFPYREAPLAEPPSRVASPLPWINDMSQTALFRLKHAADAAVNQQAAQVRAQVEGQMQDALTMAKDGKRDPNPIAPERFIAGWGPVEGQRRADEYARNQVMADHIHDFQGQSLDQINTALANAAPVEGPGYAAQSARQEIMLRAANTLIKAREDDAPLWVRNHTPAVRSLFAALESTVAEGANASDAAKQTAARNYAIASMGEQARLGIAKRAILAAPELDAIVNTVQQVAGSGDRMAQSIGMYERTWGPLWPQIYREVVTSLPGKNIPDSFIAIPAVRSMAAREEIARLDGLKIDDLKKQLAPGDEKDIHDKLQQALEPFSQSLLPNQQNGRTYNAIASSAEKMALVRRVRGATVGDAVNAAANTFLSQYEFPKAGSTSVYAVPVGEQPATVAEGARLAVGKSSLWNLLPPPDVLAQAGPGAGRTPEELAKEWQSSVSERPLWVTNADESGLLLYTTMRDGRAYQVRWPSGAPIEFTWDALRGFTQEAGGYAGSRFQPVAAPAANAREAERAAAAKRAAAEATLRAAPPGQR
jgi:hypothetical protein